MAPSSVQPITFVVRGLEQPTGAVGATRGAAPPALPAGLTRGRVKHSVRVGARRGGGAEVRVSAVPGEDIVVLHIAGGPSLVLHPANARDLMLAQSDLTRGRGADGADEAGHDEIGVTPQLRWGGLEQALATRDATRGSLGDVLLFGIDVITDLFKDPAADFAASQVVARVDGQVTAGVYALEPEMLPQLKENRTALTELPDPTSGAPLLVFVHGTFSSTAGTFSKLWTEHPQRVGALFEHYNGRVYGLDHPTLGASPITNALTLTRALPKNARLHLVTHSRGGLVAEVLARACANPDITETDLSFFSGHDYKREREDLESLAALVKKQGVRIERIVRVACPARGTLLASKRLDAYLSVFKWTLELAGIPVAPALVDFLNEVARRRADPMEVPGLAAQIPDSPLIKWLHAADLAIRSDLRVIAGDIKGDSVTSWLKTMLADSFFWTDNDLVVQTSSMYGGAPRSEGASFVLEQGGKVSHFNYFANERTAEVIVNALVQEKPPQAFGVIGQLSWAGESSTGLRAARPASIDDTATSEKPAVFVLPGILGSNLKVDGDRIWLSWRLVNAYTRLKYDSDGQNGVEPDGLIGTVYDDLVQFLEKTHEVIEFAFDWRRPIEDEARRLAKAVEPALAAREKSGQPVRLLAHSMGGLVARTMQLECPEVWQRLMSRVGARLLMLGTPNGGSWTPMQVLSGDDSFGNMLVALGKPFQSYEARQLIAEFPGFIQLQAGLLDQNLALAQHNTWKTLADQDLARLREHSWWHSSEIQLNANTWGVPPQGVLDRAVALRKRLDAQVQQALGKFNDRLLLVVGEASFTPDGYENGNKGLVYLDAPDAGDGRVTLASALLPGVSTWQLACEHGDLPKKKEAFDAYLELLNNGAVDGGILKPLTEASTARGAAVQSSPHLPSRPSRTRLTTQPPGSIREVFALGSRQSVAGRTAPGTALRVTVINSDLKFVEQPILIGHYRSLALTGTERVVDKLIGGAMKISLDAGLYPASPGAHQIFINTGVNRDNPWQLPRPKAAIVVGLGEEGKLSPSDLVHTVNQAVIGWAQRMTEMPLGIAAQFELAATLIGSGGTGITAGQAARLVAEGVRKANERLKDCEWPCVGHLYLVEIYLDRAIDAWRALQVQATAATARYVITETVQSGTGALPRLLDSGYRGVEYDFITAVTQEGMYGDSGIAYTLDTKRARSEVRAQALQGPLLGELVASASNDQSRDRRIGRTLFQLLVPIEMEPFFGGTTEMLIELDSGTAGIPWELIDTDSGGGGGRDSRPWAIRTKLLRKLRTDDFREQVVDADPDASVLVIGEPMCDLGFYPRLPGARNEAKAVVGCLTAPGALAIDKVKDIISPEDPTKFGADALTVFNALLERDWRIVHIAGHGEPPEKIGPVPTNPGDPPQKHGDPRGVVLSNGTFLGPREICNMRVVPELVFVNCCHLGARDADQLLRNEVSQLGRSYDRARFASGVAAELIKIGVRCVIAAGWAVDDDAAKSFATTFYEILLRGRRFIDAVAAAREAAFTHGGNTWGAYQCYGDPNWFFRPKAADPQRPTAPSGDEFSGVAAPQSLTLALETLAARSKFQEAPAESQRAKIRHLEARFAPHWGGMGEVAEAFGLAWVTAGDPISAIKWYERAVTANDGGASIKASEQLGNLKVRVAWEKVDRAIKHCEKLKRRLSEPKRGSSAITAAMRAGWSAQITAAEGAIRSATREARKPMSEAIALLDKLVALQPSMERHSLCGSAHKRQAMIAAIGGQPQVEKRAIAQMKLHYQKSEELGRAGQLDDIFYPALNHIAADLVLNFDQPDWIGLDSDSVAVARQSLAIKSRNNPDFWSVVGITELSVYEALAKKNLAAHLATIKAEYQDLHTRVNSAWMWASVYDQMRFVASRAPKAEQQAAEALLVFLGRFAAAEHL
jgi:pimeloyl-ACP methyl ester carboxylesterase